MNVLSDFILRVDDAISVSDAKFAAEKKAVPAKAEKTRTVKKTVKKTVAKKSVKAVPEAAAKKPSSRKTAKTKK